MAVALVALGVFAYDQTAKQRLPAFDEAESRRLVDEVQRNAGLKIEIFTENGQAEVGEPGDPNSIAITRAEPARAQIALRGVHHALQAYPRALIDDLLEEIWIVGGLAIRDFPVGGTYIGPRIYLASNHLQAPADQIHAERALHHELSSFLFLQSAFPSRAWLAAQPPEARYLPDYEAMLEATQEHAPASEAESWWRLGFVSDYGRTSLENDVNTYAEFLMAEPDELMRLGNKFPYIKAKARLLARYYAALHPDMDATLRQGPAGALLN